MELTIKEISEIKCRLPREEKTISENRIELNKVIRELNDSNAKLGKLAESLKNDEDVLYRYEPFADIVVKIPFYNEVVKNLNDIQKGIPEFEKESQKFQKALKSLDLQKVRNFKNLTPAQQKKVLSEIKDLKEMFKPFRYADDSYRHPWMKPLFDSGVNLNVNSHHLGPREKEYKEAWKPVHLNLLKYGGITDNLYWDIEKLEEKLEQNQ